MFEQTAKRNDEPEKACRPFDAGRDGIVLGEGSSVLVVEEYEHAKKRGAQVLAEVAGFGAAFDRKLDGSGLARAAKAAMKEAGIGPDDLDHVKRPRSGDAGRRTSGRRAGCSLALDGGTRRVPVFAAKGYFGNMGAASPATELIVSVLGLKHGVMPATLNHEVTDPECPVEVITRARPVTRPYVLKVAFTQMGQCGAVVIRKTVAQASRLWLSFAPAKQPCSSQREQNRRAACSTEEVAIMRRRVVITGMGAITPLGYDVKGTMEGQLAGRSGVGPIRHFDARRFPTTFRRPGARFRSDEVHP